MNNKIKDIVGRALMFGTTPEFIIGFSKLSKKDKQTVWNNYGEYVAPRGEN